jgi:NADH:ubiquinone oxidoreductase subunit 5 (subunit L)/multisubunit Na+/H+ antiporter MnhA subunit
MNETFMLYLFTRLDTLNGVLAFFGVVTMVATIISVICACIMHSDDEEYPRFFHKLWFGCAVALLFNIAVPTQKDVALILAGSTIMSIARTDEAQRITSKSVRVVEQYLDALLTKEKK